MTDEWTPHPDVITDPHGLCCADCRDAGDRWRDECAENARLREWLEDEPSKWSFQTLVAIANEIMDRYYPADIPILAGPHPDPGPTFIHALRSAVSAIHAIEEAE